MTGLPKLPGYTFSDPTITKFHISHKFDYQNGYAVPKLNPLGVGAAELDVHSVGHIQNKDPIRFDPSIVYGRTRAPAMPRFQPHFALYDQKCLTFKAFFKLSVSESPDEHYRVRQVNIIYFLEDDTITVMEPFVPNCGFKQGRLVRRGRIPKTDSGDDFWHWKDLNNGIDVCLHGIVFHTVDCDGFTREYMASQGIVINPTEDMPPDPYTQMRHLKIRPTTRVTPALDDKLRRFLEYDGKILKFNAVWDNRHIECGELKEYVVLYFLADDTVSVKEVHKLNDGCDPCLLLLRKTKLPKNWTDRPITYASVFMELSDAEVTEYYQPKDFTVGGTIYVLGRKFLLFDCDKFTRMYFEKVLKIKQGEPLDVLEKPRKIERKCMPPLAAPLLGTVEDTLQTCFQTIPTRPKQDEVRMIVNANKFLRYAMELDWVHPEDRARKFILLYSLAYGTCQIMEPPVRNSGILGGKFLRDSLIPKPGTHPYNPEYYTAGDFYIGAVLIVHSHRFIITGADLGVYRYVQANPEKFSAEVTDNIRNYMFREGYLKEDIQEKYEQDEVQRKKTDIEAVGRDLEIIKTEREKCIDRVQANLSTAAANSESEHLSMPINKHGYPYESEPLHQRGIKPVMKDCPYPVKTGTKPFNVPCPESSEIYAVKYPETEEEKLKKYYDDVLRRHDEACSQAAEYKKHNECLPGTNMTEYNPELSKKILVSPEARPQASKDSAGGKKTVTFAPRTCELEKSDVSDLKSTKTQCGCTEY